jgi:hypothetical protein
MSKRTPDIIARGPEMVFKPGTWQHEHFQGRPMYESVLDGQRFPEGATQKRLDELAQQRWHELSSTAAAQATSTVASLELPEPTLEPQVSIEREVVAA